MHIKLDILIYPTLYKEMGDNIVIFSNDINNRGWKLLYRSYSLYDFMWVYCIFAGNTVSNSNHVFLTNCECGLSDKITKRFWPSLHLYLATQTYWKYLTLSTCFRFCRNVDRYNLMKCPLESYYYYILFCLLCRCGFING